ncbi:MAG: redoxin domain-containing protein [Gammaproteobacteria bacterium]|jgi:peroxiredoxin|nr:redoxin domain-containing protein [Gammaproteobacteria bacterium]
MNKSVLIKSLVVFLLIGCFSTASAVEKAPDFQLPQIDGNTVSLSSLRGNVVYVDFWATWCPPCRESFPWMESMHQRYQDLGLQIVAISLDQKSDLIKNFLKAHQASFTILQDAEGGAAEAFKVKGMPSSYLVDRKGNIRMRHAGFNDDDKAELESKIKALLTE